MCKEYGHTISGYKKSSMSIFWMALDSIPNRIFERYDNEYGDPMTKKLKFPQMQKRCASRQLGFSFGSGILLKMPVIKVSRSMQ